MLTSLHQAERVPAEKAKLRTLVLGDVGEKAGRLPRALVILIRCHSAILTLQVPMTFIYGDRDWMDPRGGQRALAGARERRQPTTPGDLRLFTVPNSGHYTFVDQPEEFLQAMLTTCQPYIEVRTLSPDGDYRGRRARLQTCMRRAYDALDRPRFASLARNSCVNLLG